MVEYSGCSGCLGGGSGGLERWSLDELGGRVWEGSEVFGAGNFEKGGDGF